MFQEQTDKQIIKCDAYYVIFMIHVTSLVCLSLSSVNVAKSYDTTDVEMKKCHLTHF